MTTNRQVFHAGVQCLITKNKSILLGLRHGVSGHGTWSCPGGHLEFAETAVQAAIRELVEETGMVAGDAVSLPAFMTYSTNVPYVHIPVVIREVEGEPQVIDGEGVAEWRFFPLGNLPKSVFEPTGVAIDRFLTGGRAEADFQYAKIDLVSIRPSENRNRGYTIILIGEKQGASLIRQWGRRAGAGWRHEKRVFDSTAEAMSDLEHVIKQRLAHDYLLLGAIGDIKLGWLESVFPLDMDIRVQSGRLLRMLVLDPAFRAAFARDVPGSSQLTLDDQW